MAVLVNDLVATMETVLQQMHGFCSMDASFCKRVKIFISGGRDEAPGCAHGNATSFCSCCNGMGAILAFPAGCPFLRHGGSGEVDGGGRFGLWF
ncbi:hypothetical protein DEO72_LG11g1568 [Vigna unguiculata]|uniref:Uncharacterized protein n=1 Tax=Vigna unguiculata TaxID=3917 RepID=A0A4D6NQL4_VIGUN|nr:hypothetical protein DEO72_LG11g1568 [Vigna unguiculata]